MQKQDTINNRIDDEISFTDLLAPLWRARVLISVVMLVTIIASLAGAKFFATYKSQGFFQFGGAIPIVKNIKDKEPPPGISLSDFKRFAASYATSERFAEYVQEKKLESTPGIDDLRKTFASRTGIDKLVDPVYPFTKLDAKELMEQPKDSSNNVIGLRISYENSSPQIAQQMVGLLGHYAMDSMIYLIYSDALKFKHSEMQSKMIKLDNVIITNKQLLNELHRKGADLKQIVSRYPESPSQAARQVVSVSDESARYLSPVTQLVTTEVRVSEANEAILKAKREQQQNQLLMEYYDRAKVLLDGTKSGETVLRGLEPIKENVFKDKNMDDEVVKEVYNTITIDNQDAINVYLEKSHFIAGPSLPSNITQRLSVVLLMSAILGFLLSVVLVVGRNWWRDNHTKLSIVN